MDPTTAPLFPTKGPYRIAVYPRVGAGQTEPDPILVTLSGPPTVKQLDAISNAQTRIEKDRGSGIAKTPDSQIGKDDEAYAAAFDALATSIEGMLGLDGKPVDPLPEDWRDQVPLGIKRRVIRGFDRWTDGDVSVRMGGAIIEAKVGVGEVEDVPVRFVLRTPTLPEKRAYDRKRQAHNKGKEVWTVNHFASAAEYFDTLIQTVEGYDNDAAVPPSHKWLAIIAFTVALEGYAGK